MNTMILALALFAGMYVLLLIFADYRWIIALSAAAVPPSGPASGSG